VSLTNKDTIDLFCHATVRFPGGSQNSPLLIEVGGVTMQAIFLPCEEGIVSFGLFLPQQRYSRKTILIDKNGFFSENTVGVIPDFDITKNEPNFYGVDNREIISKVWEELKK